MSKFNGERLKSARLLRKYSIQELAELVQISRQVISQYESGRSMPTTIKVEEIAGVLDVPYDYFYEDTTDVSIITTFFRAQATTPKNEKDSQIVKIQTILAVFQFLKDYIEFPVQNIPQDESAADIPKAAKALREAWELGNGPINDLLAHAENNGVFATSLSTGNSKIDAFSINTRSFGEPIFIMALGNEKQSATRRNFNIAHELGHLVLNHYEDGESAHLEDEANEFAAEFLMPAEEFLNDLVTPNKLKPYVDLKRKWKVSISAMIIRAYKLNAITKTEYQNLMRQMAVNKWRVKEPLDDSIEIEQPYTFKLAIDMLLDNNVFTEKQFMESLSNFGLSLHHYFVEELFDLEPDRLKPKQENKVSLRLIKSK